MNIAIACFRRQGQKLAEKLDMGSVTRIGEESGVTLEEWTKAHFATSDALIFVGACGIAVRAIAPYVEHKTNDPAVVVVDDSGTFAISLLSGHLGGANALAQQVAERLGAIPVITTATDRQGTFAVDTWAKKEGLGIENPEEIKHISAAVLEGHAVTVEADGHRLHLTPKRLVLGVGCKKNTDPQAMWSAYESYRESHGFSDAAICGIATIDLKKEEPAILQLAKRIGVSLATYTAEELAAVEGVFSASEFVAATTGVDNVCERAAVRRSRGTLLYPKEARDGMTFALACTPDMETWSWKQ